MKSRAVTTIQPIQSIKATRKPSQAGKPRMGRPPSKAYHKDCVSQTRELMMAIKAGAGNLSNAQIEQRLGIGRDETGACSGKYFGRYLNSPKSTSHAALSPDRLSQIAQRARQEGWIAGDEKRGGLTTPGPFKHLEVAEGELLSEKILDLKAEQARLHAAQAQAIAALENLVAQMDSCKSMRFVHAKTDVIDEEQVDVLFDGLNLDLQGAIRAIAAGFVVSEEVMGSTAWLS